MNPRRRTEDLESQWVADEMVVYDHRVHRVHTLAPLRAQVFELADGSRTLDEILHVLRERNVSAASEEQVRREIQGLVASSLMEEMDFSAPGMSRRDLLSNAAAVAGVAFAGASLQAMLWPSEARADQHCGGLGQPDCAAAQSGAGPIV